MSNKTASQLDREIAEGLAGSTPQRAQSFVIRADVPMGAWSDNRPVFRAFHADGTPVYMADANLEALKRKIRENYKVKTIKVFA